MFWKLRYFQNGENLTKEWEYETEIRLVPLPQEPSQALYFNGTLLGFKQTGPVGAAVILDKPDDR